MSGYWCDWLSESLRVSKCGSCVSGTKGPKAFPGAGAQRAEGEGEKWLELPGEGEVAL